MTWNTHSSISSLKFTHFRRLKTNRILGRLIKRRQVISENIRYPDPMHTHPPCCHRRNQPRATLARTSYRWNRLDFSILFYCAAMNSIGCLLIQGIMGPGLIALPSARFRFSASHLPYPETGLSKKHSSCNFLQICFFRYAFSGTRCCCCHRGLGHQDFPRSRCDKREFPMCFYSFHHPPQPRKQFVDVSVTVIGHEKHVPFLKLGLRVTPFQLRV